MLGCVLVVGVEAQLFFQGQYRGARYAYNGLLGEVFLIDKTTEYG